MIQNLGAVTVETKGAKPGVEQDGHQGTPSR